MVFFIHINVEKNPEKGVKRAEILTFATPFKKTAGLFYVI